jgi:hypothetical protein
VDALVSFFTSVDRNEMNEVSSDFQEVMGRPAMALKDFFKMHASELGVKEE